jgi:glutamine---fructose-6-phosphate transaminase (isomerizing)
VRRDGASSVASVPAWNTSCPGLGRGEPASWPRARATLQPIMHGLGTATAAKTLTTAGRTARYGAHMSHMRETMWTQPDELRRLVADHGSARVAAERIRGRRTWLVGIGTSWHAAHHGAWLLHEAGVDAFALHAADVAPYERRFDAADAVVVLSHTGHTGYTAQTLDDARAAGAAIVHVTGIGAGGDVETVAPETSYAYTASHTGALLRLAQMAEALGAALGDLAAVPDAVARVLAADGPIVDPPARLLELIGAGPNAWTAQEGALKVREAAYVATEGLSAEQFLHGPSVALDAQDTLVVLDGGGPGAVRTEAIATAMEVTDARVVRIADRDLGEPLSIFPLTVRVQRIALELAEARGVSPDRFRYEEDPRREQAVEALGF